MKRRVFLLPILPLILGLGVSNSGAVENAEVSTARFVGADSCGSTSCHGGGTGHNESLIYQRRDRHAVSYGILSKGTSLRIAEALKMTGDPAKDARCNICHAPVLGVAEHRLPPGGKADRGVTCESCHGAAENWVRYHTRPDVNYQQIVAAGMRDLNSLYVRANTCVACHLNVEQDLIKAGHPELYFELDGQCLAQPPHYRDARPSLGPRSWMTGQAVALREVSWKLTTKYDASQQPRWEALAWLLRKAPLGKSELPETNDYKVMQGAADAMARKAAVAAWTNEDLAKLLKAYVSVAPEFSDVKADKVLLRRKAEVLAPAIDRLWQEYKRGLAGDLTAFESSLEAAHQLAMDHEAFDPARFAGVMGELELAWSKVGAK